MSRGLGYVYKGQRPQGPAVAQRLAAPRAQSRLSGAVAVPYTHMTLPTIRTVKLTVCTGTTSTLLEAIFRQRLASCT